MGLFINFVSVYFQSFKKNIYCVNTRFPGLCCVADEIQCFHLNYVILLALRRVDLAVSGGWEWGGD